MRQYNPDDFTLMEYSKLLEQAKKNFNFVFHSEIKEAPVRSIVWRHDVDFSLEQAFKVALIELEKGIQSTYFLHLNNEFYNLLEKNSIELVKEIISFGHLIGLHFDISIHHIQSEEDLKYWLLFEKNILETLFGIKVMGFSFHNTNQHCMKYEADHYAGMINCYSSYFKNKIHYCSDSNGFWRFSPLNEVLNDNSIQKLQVLTHPGWWTENRLLPREKVECYSKSRHLRTMSQYDNVLKEYDRLNIQ